MSGFLDRLWSKSPAAPATAAPPADNFPRSFAMLIGHEGSYVNDPHDPGGETKYGITKRTYPAEDIKNLTLARAQELYRRDFWDKCRCGEMPWPVAHVVMDCAVNQGQGRAGRFLQMALKVPVDGVIGPQTLAALAKADPVDVVTEVQAQRIMAYVALPGWGRYGLGWSRRAFKVLAQAVG